MSSSATATTLTLIVATTPVPSNNAQQTTRLGIGLNGTLPWPRIKTDMTFFARVTSRPPASAPGTTNAIIMGRKTYLSIPEKLRPLGKRVSVIVCRGGDAGSGDGNEGISGLVTRELQAKRERDAARRGKMVAEGNKAPTQTQQGGEKKESEAVTDTLVSSSLENAVRDLGAAYGDQGRLGGIYIIGGGEVYASSLRSDILSDPAYKVRVVMTDVRKTNGDGFGCDTFFPVNNFNAQNGWRTASSEEISGWVGEEVTGEWIEEGDVRVRMVGYERV